MSRRNYKRPTQAMKAPYNNESHKAKCGAKKRNGERCKNPAGYKTDHPGYGTCAYHLGATANHGKHARRQMAAEAVVTYGLPREIDPHDALLEEIWRTAGHVDWLSSVIQDQKKGDLVWGDSKAVTGSDESSTIEQRAGVNTWLKLYQDERKHLTEVCRVAIGCGIAERQVRLAEQHGKMIATVITGVLSDLGINEDVLEVGGEVIEVREVVRNNLMMIDAVTKVS